ncbi:hypothetical protein H671_1g0660 [Cricetulus griseus]|nr:hypothetical protein H671_1g0660 [Cricetulus griseus]
MAAKKEASPFTSSLVLSASVIGPKDALADWTRWRVLSPGNRSAPASPYARWAAILCPRGRKLYKPDDFLEQRHCLTLPFLTSYHVRKINPNFDRDVLKEPIPWSEILGFQTLEFDERTRKPSVPVGSSC